MSKRKLAMLVAELVGTFVLAIVVLSINRYGLPIFTALSAGAAIAMMYVAVGPVSGGHFNPAITLGFFSVRRISLLKAISYLAAQAVGAVLAWKLYEWFVDKPIAQAASEFDWKVFVAELLGTLVFAFAFAAAINRKLDSYTSSVVMGTGLFLGASLASLVAAAGAVNPAVALSIGFRPENASYLAYFFGPVIGAVVGMNFYRMAFDESTTAPAVAAATVVAPVATKKVAPVKRKTTAKKPAARKSASRTRK